MVVLVIIGVHEIIALNLTMGGLIAAVVLSSRAIAPIGQVATLLTQFQQTGPFRSLETLMNSEVERKSTQSYVRRPEFDGDIKFKNVSFSYPEAETATLKVSHYRFNPVNTWALSDASGPEKPLAEANDRPLSTGCRVAACGQLGH